MLPIGAPIGPLQPTAPAIPGMFGGIPAFRTVICHAMDGRKLGPPPGYMAIIKQKG